MLGARPSPTGSCGRRCRAWRPMSASRSSTRAPRASSPGSGRAPPPGLPHRRLDADAGPRLPHVELRERGRPGIGAPPGLLLHARARVGLRGAADASGDGRVTLGESYQFAFQETLAQTTTTQGGAQHPAYDIRCRHRRRGHDRREAGHGRPRPGSRLRRPVLRPRRQAAARRRALQAAGRRAQIAVEPGTYEVQYEEEKKLYSGGIVVPRASGERSSGKISERRRARRRGFEARTGRHPPWRPSPTPAG